MPCTPWLSLLAPPPHPSTRLRHHHQPAFFTPSLCGCVPRAGSGSRGFHHHLHLPPPPAQHIQAHSTPNCTTTWEYRHLINGFFCFVFPFLFGSNDIDIKCYDIFGTIWELLEGAGIDHFNCTTMSIVFFPGYRRHMIPTSPTRRQAELRGR
jgi:hypothetical protein